MILNRIEQMDLETKVNFYRSCINVSLSDDFNLSNIYTINGIRLSATEVLSITNFIIDIYGGRREKRRYNIKFGYNVFGCQDIASNGLSLDRAKYIYEFRQEYGYDEEKCKEFAKYMGISLVDITAIARDYAVKHLRLRLDEYDWLYYKNVAVRDGHIKSELPYQILFDLFLMMDDNEDIIFLIEYSKQNLYSLFKNIDRYIQGYCEDKTDVEKEKIINELTNKLNLYKNRKEEDINRELQEQNKEQQKLAESMVLEYVNCDKTFATITDYCRYKGILYGYFRSKTIIVKKSNPQLYEAYCKRLKLNRINGSDDENQVANLVCYYVENGVATEEGTREFDLIDYYAMTALKVDDVFRNCEKRLSRENARKLAKMRNLKDRTKSILSPSVRAIDIDVEFNCQKDDAGFPIPGTGRRISQEEVDTIIEIFELYNIPFNLFKVATDRIKNGVDLHDVAPFEIKTDNKVKKLVKTEQE